MTTITFYKDQNGAYRQVVCKGHAAFAQKGKPDILCAAISTLLISTNNALEELCGERIQEEADEQTGFIRLTFSEETALQEKSVFLLDFLKYSMESLSKQYGEKYLKVKIKEV
ncbi:MAG: ribosomal-processing cysteine protease Prp [Lachnospiraceae bacterium]|nr:ribosomal-processing cysteine protease Prp [Lachnospiraceae bacterium]